jgi:hypothetical protein
MAQSGLSETSACLSAFGAKQTCFGLWPSVVNDPDRTSFTWIDSLGTQQ